MGQYVRAMIDAAFMKETKITELPLEALNMLLVLLQAVTPSAFVLVISFNVANCLFYVVFGFNAR